MLITKSKSFYYNDVNLLASKPTIVHSRSEVSIDRSKIIISPMASIVGSKLAQAATDNGLAVCLHRFCTPEKQVEIYNSLNNKSDVFLSVGLNDIDRINGRIELMSLCLRTCNMVMWLALLLGS